MPVYRQTDASKVVLKPVISQKSCDNKLHLITYHLPKFLPAEIDYEIQDKELTAVVDSCKIWPKYLNSALLPVLVYTEHQNLE
jgi:hypothetical protein